MFAASDAGIDDPAAPALADLDWRDVSVPGTVASALRDLGAGADDRAAIGRRDHWFRCHFARPTESADASMKLELAGLASIADVWLNGEHVLHSDSMFVAHALDVTDRLQGDNELVLRFHALLPALGKRRPRPRWRTALVKPQTLRYFRQTLLGHVTAWCPDTIAVGPWRGIDLVVDDAVVVQRRSVRTSVVNGTGVVTVMLQLQPCAGTDLDGGRLVVGDHTAELEIAPGENGASVAVAQLEIADVELWWPHTHGGQPLYPAAAELRAGGETLEVRLGSLGFRTIGEPTLDRPGLAINGVEIHARGACWTTLDLDRLSADPEAYREALTTARYGGLNMLRVGGTMVYEHDAFYRLCDELGILVWQDFMFANMDYPIDDPEFRAAIELESKQFLERTQTSCSLTVLCGGSEVEQQAAMLGLPQEAWSNEWFAAGLPAICRELRPDLPYWPSSPTGGELPFHVGTGIAHYFGVGAYQRPLADARLNAPRFASECLAFSNVPEPESLLELGGGALLGPHHPDFKRAVARDPGTGWDFTDVTDHYVERLFGIDSRDLRYADCERYYQHCRVAIGEVLATTAGHWRAADCRNQGALIWFYRDLVLGAGWGIVDAAGRPKSAYHYLRRAWAPRAVWFVDDGLDGLIAHVANDGPAPLTAKLQVRVLGPRDVVTAEAETEVEVGPHAQAAFGVDRLLGRFCDTTYSYRFGPRGHHVIAVRLVEDGADEAIAEACYFPSELPSVMDPDVRVEAEVSAQPADGDIEIFDVTFRSSRLCQAVAIDAPGYRPSDNYFHVLPGAPRTVRLRGRAPRGLRGFAQPFNSPHTVRLVVAPDA